MASSEPAPGPASGATPRAAVVVFAGGDGVDGRVRALLPPVPYVIAADSGLHHALALGYDAHEVVGDLDSVDAEALARAEQAGARIEAHPTDKDATDLELALHAARRAGAREVVVVGVGGGRLDHFLANALVLAAPDLHDVAITALVPPAVVTVVHRAAVLRGEPGTRCSLLPVGGPARGVRTTGLRWALHGEELRPGTTRGVSNELVAPTATVELDGGVLLAVQPEGIPT